MRMRKNEQKTATATLTEHFENQNFPAYYAIKNKHTLWLKIESALRDTQGRRHYMVAGCEAPPVQPLSTCGGGCVF